MSVRMEQFLPMVWPSAPNCPLPIVYDHVRNAAEEFCTRTRTWRYIVTMKTGAAPEGAGLPYTLPFDLGAGLPSIVEVYMPEMPEGAVIFELERAHYDRRCELLPVSYVDHTPHEWTSDATPREICQVEPGGFILYGRGTGNLDLTLSLFLKPNSGGPAHDLLLPDWMLSSHGRLIADGAIARICALPGKVWTNPDVAAFHGTNFMEGLDRFSTANVRGQQGARMRTRSRYI